MKKVLTSLLLLLVIGCGPEEHGYGSHIVLNGEYFDSYKDFQLMTYRVDLASSSMALPGEEFSITLQSSQGLGDGADGVVFHGKLGEVYCVRFTKPLNDINVQLGPKDDVDGINLVAKVGMMRGPGPAGDCALVLVGRTSNPAPLPQGPRIVSLRVRSDAFDHSLLHRVDIETEGFEGEIEADGFRCEIDGYTSRVFVHRPGEPEWPLVCLRPRVVTVNDNRVITLSGIEPYGHYLEPGEYAMGVDVYSATESAHRYDLYEFSIY